MAAAQRTARVLTFLASLILVPAMVVLSITAGSRWGDDPEAQAAFWATVSLWLLALVLLHALLGVRAFLLDFGLPLRWHRALFALALVLAGGLFVAIWLWRWY